MDAAVGRFSHRSADDECPVYQIRPTDAKTATSSASTPPEPYSELCFPRGARIRFTPNGRYAVCFWNAPSRLTIVDLVHNTQRVFRSRILTEKLWFEDVLFVNSNTILPIDADCLWLLRLSAEDEHFRAIPLNRFRCCRPAFVLTEISGAEIQRAIIRGDSTPDQLLFARLDVDRRELRVDAHVAASPDSSHFGFCPNGRFLVAFGKNPRVCDVYEIETKTWQRVEFYAREFLWSKTCVYLFDHWQDEKADCSLFCCDLRRLEWTKRRLPVVDVCRISPIVNAETGLDEGLLIVCGREGERKRIYRLLFDKPDLLVRLAVDALRKSRVDVAGKEGFRAIMSEESGRRHFPPIYPNMEPIPRRSQ
ncbi:hypothetical protein M3Y99_01300800 [Aphelenchoides fujianensis]|nr:hypothetical protein M3Y99_01300800 [Aphelenchoides fujianensis]